MDFLSLSAWNISSIMCMLPDRHTSFQSLHLHHTRQSILPTEHPSFHGINGSVLPRLPASVLEIAPGISLHFLMRSFLIFNFIKHSSSFRMTLMPQEYFCALFHSRMYLISATRSFFWFLIASSLRQCRICPRLPGCHTTSRAGNITGGCFACTARKFPESLADYNLESIFFLVGRNSYHYPPPMILAKDLRKSIHSYKNSLRMRTGTDSFFTKWSSIVFGQDFS